MNKILVEVSVGELLDKISILEIKKGKIKDPKKLKFINDEYNILKSQINYTNPLSSNLVLTSMLLFPHIPELMSCLQLAS